MPFRTTVGSPLDVQNDQDVTRTVLADILSALTWLHSHNIVHRDVRKDNIVVTPQPHAILIDFGAATDYTSAKPQRYAGGYICCPEELIGHFEKDYFPAPKHDLIAYVMLVNLLIWPTRLHAIRSDRVGGMTAEAMKLRNYWREMRKSEFWGRFVSAAEQGDEEGLTVLRELVGLVVMI